MTSTPDRHSRQSSLLCGTAKAYRFFCPVTNTSGHTANLPLSCINSLWLQKVKEVGGTYLCGVNYCAMDKYPGVATAKGLKNCTDSLKVQTSALIM